MQQETGFRAVGKRLPKLDGPEIATGRAVYADDIRLPGMLYGRILHSPHPHARIRRIDVRRSRRLRGVVDVVTSKDVADLSLFASDEVCYEGHKVAAVAAEDPDIAEDALGLIQVDYEVLPAVIDPIEAMAPDAPPVRLDVQAREISDESGQKLSNVVGHREMQQGDVAEGFAGSDAVVEAEYRIPFFHQNYLEPNAATARVEPDGRITIWSAVQGSFIMRDAVARALKLPQHRIRVIATKMGGGFGAKNDLFVEAHAALLALRTKRPVKVRMDREEEFKDGLPAPGCVISLKLGARKDGGLTALQGRAVWDAGWSGGGGGVDRLRALYRIPNIDLRGFAVRTNKPSPGAYRAPGAPQTAFARESTIDLLARELKMDPVEIRLKNAIGPGESTLGGRPLPGDWLKQTLRGAAGAAGWGKPLEPHQGRGIACGEWTNASGPTNAFISLGEDGSVTVVTGQVDITGVHTVLAQIVAEELGLPPEKVIVTLGDTDTVPYTSLSAGSKSTYSAGTAARRAARAARKRILEAAAKILEVSEKDLELVDERVRVAGAPDRSVSLAELATGALWSADGPIAGQSVLGPFTTHPSYYVDVATVEVDPLTGRVRLIDLIAAQHVGRALNPTLVEGQIDGGVVQAMGLAMMEGYRYDNEGHLLNANLLDYPLPTTEDVPNIRTVLVEEPCADGPYGAKGVGEPPIIPGAAAIANAIHDAVGVRVTHLPITPERVLEALRRLRS